VIALTTNDGESTLFCFVLPHVCIRLTPAAPHAQSAPRALPAAPPGSPAAAQPYPTQTPCPPAKEEEKAKTARSNTSFGHQRGGERGTYWSESKPLSSFTWLACMTAVASAWAGRGEHEPQGSPGETPSPRVPGPTHNLAALNGECPTPCVLPQLRGIGGATATGGVAPGLA
jgi:hypothetical protein